MPTHRIRHPKFREFSLVGEGDNPGADMVIAKVRPVSKALPLLQALTGERFEAIRIKAQAIADAIGGPTPPESDDLCEMFDGLYDLLWRAQSEAQGVAAVLGIEPEATSPAVEKTATDGDAPMDLTKLLALVTDEKVRKDIGDYIAAQKVEHEKSIAEIRKSIPAPDPKEEMLKSLPEAVRAEIAKNHERIAELEKQAKATADERELATFIEKAKPLAVGGITAPALGGVLKAVTKALPAEDVTAFEKWLAGLSGIRKEAAKLTEETGKAGAEGGESAHAKLMTLAKARAATDKNLSVEQAYEVVGLENPELLASAMKGE